MSKKMIRSALVAGCALLLMTLAAPRAKAFSNTEAVENDTGTSETEMDVELEGDQTGSIDGYSNPFGSGGTESASYNSITNETTVEFGNGSEPAVTPDEVVDVGIDDENPEMFEGKEWVQPTEQEEPAPTIDGTDQASGPDTIYELIDEQVQASGDTQSSEEITELQVMRGQTMEVELENDDTLDGPLFAFNVGFQFSNTEIPLDDLNLTDYPPSSFTPVPGISDDTPLSSPDYSSPINVPLPEPGCLTLLGAGAMFFGGRRRGRTAASR
jgi:hypothetical protein